MNMYRLLLTPILLILVCNLATAQIKGKVTTLNGQPIQSTTVLLQNTYTATSTNANGEFELKIGNQDSCVLIFQSLGFQTHKVTWKKHNRDPFLHII